MVGGTDTINITYFVLTLFGDLKVYSRVCYVTVSIFLSDAVVVVLVRKILMKPLKVKVTFF